MIWWLTVFFICIPVRWYPSGSWGITGAESRNNIWLSNSRKGNVDRRTTYIVDLRKVQPQAELQSAAAHWTRHCWHGCWHSCFALDTNLPLHLMAEADTSFYLHWRAEKSLRRLGDGLNCRSEIRDFWRNCYRKWWTDPFQDCNWKHGSADSPSYSRCPDCCRIPYQHCFLHWNLSQGHWQEASYRLWKVKKNTLDLETQDHKQNMITYADL